MNTFHSNKYNQTVTIMKNQNNTVTIEYVYQEITYQKETFLLYNKVSDSPELLEAIVDEFIEETQSQVILDSMWEAAKHVTTTN